MGLCIEAERVAKPTGLLADDVLSYGRLGLQAKQVVGVIQSDGCRLEILPKIDTDDERLARRTLIGMLAAIHDFEVNVGAQAAIEEQTRDVLESLISFFLTRLEREVRRGLPRAYIPHSDDVKHLRGTLNIPRQFTVLAASPDRVACRYDELSSDTAVARILKCACQHLSRVSVSQVNQRKLRDLLCAFANVSDLDPNQALLAEGIILDRTNSAYRSLLDQAYLFLRQRWQSVYAGSSSGFALLFPMNMLFEAYVGRIARQLQGVLHCDVRLQGPHKFALEAESGTRHFKTKPDIFVEFGRDCGRTIIDTKWKQLARTDRGAPWGISNSDIYQMLTYAEVYDAGRVVLLYPHSAQLGIAPGIVDRFYSQDRRRRIDVATIDLSVLTDVKGQLAGLLDPNPASLSIDG